MLILGLHPAWHDSAAALFDDYRLVAAVQTERLTRIKGDGGGIPVLAIDEVLAVAGASRRDVDAIVLTRGVFPPAYFNHWTPWQRFRMGLPYRKAKRARSIERQTRLKRTTDAGRIFAGERFRADLGFRPDARLHFCNHHGAHALSALFFTDWDDALVYTADGGGDNVQYSARRLAEGRLTPLFGDDREFLTPRRIDSLGMAYGLTTKALGFRMLRHEGKLTGLAAFGQPVLAEEIARHFRLEESGRIDGGYPSYEAMEAGIMAMAARVSREDMAASIQKVLEDFILASIRRLRELQGGRNLALAGGVFANVRLNRLVAEESGAEEAFIFPGMGDEGLAVGGALEFLLERDGLARWLAGRYRLEDVSLGRGFDRAIGTALLAAGAKPVPGAPAASAAKLLAAGMIGALYAGRTEYGPRALGNRSILASPADRDINDSLNQRLERSEFMPFAPVVAAEDAAEVFEVTSRNAYACRFMTITCAVKPRWAPRIPAVVHIDGTARPQIIERSSHPLYYDILAGFKALTGLPVLVNTSFNAHEEPIIHTPADCARALKDGRIDFVVTAEGVFAANEAALARALAALATPGEAAAE